MDELDCTVNYPCPICGQKYPTEYSMEEHALIHDPNYFFTCPTCSKKFKRKRFLRAHIKSVHTGFKPYFCPICGDRFKRRIDMRAHEHCHVHEPLFQCALCPRKFNCRNNLYDHMRVHSENTDNRKYPCAHCTKIFRSKSGLEDHITTHSEILLFYCDLCDKGFSRSNALGRHKRTHYKMSYPCPRCKRTFLTKSSMNRHIKELHTGMPLTI